MKVTVGPKQSKRDVKVTIEMDLEQAEFMRNLYGRQSFRVMQDTGLVGSAEDHNHNLNQPYNELSVALAGDV